MEIQRFKFRSIFKYIYIEILKHVLNLLIRVSDAPLENFIVLILSFYIRVECVNTYCVLFYGREMWNMHYNTKHYRKISVSYHASLKIFYRSLDFLVIILFVCSFENLLNFEQMRFLFWLRKWQSMFLPPQNLFFFYIILLFRIEFLKYGIKNILLVIFMKMNKKFGL